MPSAATLRKPLVSSAKGSLEAEADYSSCRKKVLSTWAKQARPVPSLLPWAPAGQSPGLVTSSFHSLLAVPAASLDPALGIRAGLVCAAGAGGISRRDKLKWLSIMLEMRSETFNGSEDEWTAP